MTLSFRRQTFGRPIFMQRRSNDGRSITFRPKDTEPLNEGLIKTSNFNDQFYIRLERFINTEKILYTDECASLMQNQLLKSEV